MTADLPGARRTAFEAGLRLTVEAEPVPLAGAGGRTLAEAVIARVAVPPFDSAAMDGWIVAGPGPWRLGPLIEIGSAPLEEPPDAGTARAIGTGAPVPPGPVALLRAERGRVASAELTALPAAPLPEPGDDVRPAGGEARQGDVVLPAGAVLTAARLAAAAAAGADLVRVRRPPSIDLVVTGDELIPAGLPGPGGIRDALGPALPALIAALGGEVASAHLVGDGIEALGCEPLVDEIRMRPGHPTVLARRPDGRPVLCLPGNPHAALVALALVGGPLLAGLLGRPEPLLPRLAVAVALPNGSAHDVRVVPSRFGEGGIVPVGTPLLHGLPDAELLALVPPGGAAAGDLVEALLLA